MHDWQKKGGNQYGAFMGRGNDLPEYFRGEVQVHRVPLDDGGYDPGGAYWGAPSNLYCAVDRKGRVWYHRGSPEDFAKVLPRAKIVPASEVTDDDIEDMLDAYMRCALWSSTDESTESGGEPMDANYSESDIHPDTVAEMRKDCAKFAHENAATLLAAMQERPACDWVQAGHDLWLNRNGHGCGFWDGDWPKPASEVLSEAAKNMGGYWLTVGDDGKVH